MNSRQTVNPENVETEIVVVGAGGAGLAAALAAAEKGAKVTVIEKRPKPGGDTALATGLYAAGSNAGGWESDTYNAMLPGTAFGFAITSGRIAGENAVRYAGK